MDQKKRHIVVNFLGEDFTRDLTLGDIFDLESIVPGGIYQLMMSKNAGQALNMATMRDLLQAYLPRHIDVMRELAENTDKYITPYQCLFEAIDPILLALWFGLKDPDTNLEDVEASGK